MNSPHHSQIPSFDAERRAWCAVMDHPPGSEHHDPEAWAAWLEAAAQAGNDSTMGAL